MTSHTPDLPICDLSFRGEWTPLNRIFFSQCVQESDDENDSQQKLRWKRKRFPYKNGKIKRNYIVYEYVSSESKEPTSDKYVSSSESEVPAFDECNSADMYENILTSSNSSDHEDINVADENGLFDGHKERAMIKKVLDDNESGSKPELTSDGLINSVDEQKNDRQSAVEFRKYIADKSELSDELGIFSTDEYTTNDSSDELVMSSNDECSNDSSDDYEKRSKKNIKNSKAVKSSKLSEYEKMVQKNRDDNMALMKSLKLFKAKESFKKAVKTLKPIRKSKRIHQFTEDSDNLVEEVDERTNTKADEETKKTLRQSARLKSLRKKKQETPAPLQSSKLDFKLSPALPFEKVIKKGHTYHDFISEVSGSEYKIPQLLDNEYVSHFKKMALLATLVISSSPISSMAVHESPQKIIICVGNVNGEIVFWHVNSDYDFCTFQPHHQRVNCLKFNPYLPNVLISSSIDGTVYYGDLEKKIFNQIFKVERCSHFDLLSQTSYLVAHGTRYVSIVDIRNHSKAFEKRHDCIEDAVKTISLHPVKTNYFISAHQKGVVKLWDLRKLQNVPVIVGHCKGKNLMSSSFSPVTGNSVLVTMSDSICLFDSSSLNEEFKLKESIEHDNFTFGWTPFQATWLPNTDDTFIVGSKLIPRRIEIFDDKLNNLFNFKDEHLNCITPINAFHPSLPVLASASRRSVFIFSESE